MSSETSPSVGLLGNDLQPFLFKRNATNKGYYENLLKREIDMM